MSEERKPVMCPWCKLSGCNVVMAKQRESVGMTTGEDYYFCPECHSHSPHIATSDGNWDKASNDCYLAASRTPPNKPMTLPELFDLADDDAAWVVSENGKIWAMGAECAQEWASEERCLFFASKPTNADIAAARKERT